MNPIVKQLSDAAERLSSLSGSAIANEFNSFINTFFGLPLKAAKACIVDADGQRTGEISSVIYSTFTPPPEGAPLEIQADTAGCAITITETMDIEQFRHAYSQIVSTKQLKKAPAPDTRGVPNTTITLGVIFAKDSTMPLEKLAEELDRLNQQTPSEYWPDMLAILSQGIINYGAQFPSEKVGGDFLPPAAGALQNYIPPVYVVIVMKPTGAYTLHQMLAFIAAHMGIFSPGARLPDNLQMREGSPKHLITSSGYQYNLQGQLKPVPREFYNDRYLPPRPLIIHDLKGKPMGAIQFIPWQDGGVVLLRGKLPLEGLLIFAGKEALKGGIMKRDNDVQLSHVIPMTQASFFSFLTTFQRRSNMTVRPDTVKIVKQKIADEGASSPFMARLFMGPLVLRDNVFDKQSKQDEFSNIFENLITSLMNLRKITNDLTKQYTEHAQKVASGQIARIQGGSIQIDEYISRDLKKHIKDFLNDGVRVIKNDVQNITDLLQINIGFLFQKQDGFVRGLAAMRATDAALADYLEQTRLLWSECLVEDTRNAMEHRGWKLSDVTYVEDGRSLKAVEPQVAGRPVTEFANFMLDRIFCFVEEVITHCMQSRLPAGITLNEIPLAQRAQEMPIRFQNTLAGGGMPTWRISYHTTRFDEV